MRFGLLIILIALAVLLVLHFGKGKQTNPVKEADIVLDKTKLAILPSQLQQVDEALDAYAAEHSAYPGKLAELVPDYLPQADLLIDPWGTRLRLERRRAENASLVCAGPDRVFGTGDDSRRSL
jgi:hypothetical protein